MLKAIVASFVGTFLALAAVVAVTVIVADKVVDRVAGDISSRIAEQLAVVREGAEAAQAKRALLAAFGECVAGNVDGGERPAAAVKRCLDKPAAVEP